MKRPQATCESGPLGEVTWALLRFLVFIVLFLGMGNAPRWVRELVLGGSQFRTDGGTKRLVRPLDGFTGPPLDTRGAIR